MTRWAASNGRPYRDRRTKGGCKLDVGRRAWRWSRAIAVTVEVVRGVRQGVTELRGLQEVKLQVGPRKVPIDEVTEDDRQALTEDDGSAEPALLDGPRRGPCCRARWFTRQQDRVSDHRVRSKEIRPRQLVPLLRWCSRSPRACSIIWWVASVRPRQISGQAESH